MCDGINVCITVRMYFLVGSIRVCSIRIREIFSNENLSSRKFIKHNFKTVKWKPGITMKTFLGKGIETFETIQPRFLKSCFKNYIF